VAEENINVECGVVYGAKAGESLLLDVYRALPLVNRWPAVVLVVPIGQSRRLVVALRAVEIEVEYAELADAGHDDLAWDGVVPAALAFLARHLRTAG
jgi:hypothetical protein